MLNLVIMGIGLSSLCQCVKYIEGKGKCTNYTNFLNLTMVHVGESHEICMTWLLHY